jgi:hypothetical protein
MNSFYAKNEERISRLATIIIFLALIRTISEPLRLQYYSSTLLTVNEIKPFLFGAIICAVGLLCLTIMAYYKKHKIIIGLAVLIIVSLFWIKFTYLN